MSEDKDLPVAQTPDHKPAKVAFWLDASTLFGHIKGSTAVRMFIGATVIFAIVVGFVMFYLLHLNGEVRSLIMERKAVRDQQQVQVEQQQVNAEKQIKDLACFAVKLVPPGRSETTDSLRKKYKCPAFTPPLVVPPSATPKS